jgi:hypothetical protein
MAWAMMKQGTVYDPERAAAQDCAKQNNEEEFP